MRKFIITILLAFVSIYSHAQFNQRLNTARGESAVDSTAMSAARSIQQVIEPEPLNFTLYSDAYDKFVRRELFKQRNKIKVKSSLQITQTAFDNWAAGGNNSFAARAWANIEHVYTKNAFNVKSTFEGAYTLTAGEDYVRKSEDFFNLSSKPNWKIARRWEISGEMNLKSQFVNSYKAPGDTLLVSSFFAPATLKVSAGITYKQPKTNLEIFLAPLSGSLLMVLNDELAAKGGFGMDAGKKIEPQFGAFLQINYNVEFAKKKINYTTKLETFWQYNRTIPTLWWENKLNFKFTNIFGASIYLLTIYNDQIKTPRAESENNFWQINESLGFGLTFNFESKPYKAPAKSDITKARSTKKRRT